MRKGTILWERLQDVKPMLVSVASAMFKSLPDAAETSKRTGEVIKLKLATREIAKRVLASGYHSRSKNFAAYVRCLLREHGRFVTNSDGLWALRATP